MILPTKYTHAHDALVGAGALVLEETTKPVPLSNLWEAVKGSQAVQTYERFVLTLDMLHIIGVIDFQDNLVVRVER